MASSTPFYSSKDFLIGLALGAVIAAATYWAIFDKDKDDSTPIVGVECTALPTDPAKVRRIGTASARTTEETDELQSLIDNFVTKYGNDVDGCNGGRIDRCAFTAILNSTDTTENYISYKLGLDSDNKVVLMFNGGYIDPFVAGGRFEQPLILMNGRDPNMFCPKQCDRSRWLLP